jgi:hemoglobin-like flavoprotein
VGATPSRPSHGVKTTVPNVARAKTPVTTGVIMVAKNPSTVPQPGTGALSAHECKLVQTSFAKVEPIAEQAAQLFYDRLFALRPELSGLFKGDMKEQRRKLMAMIKIAVRGLNNVEKPMPALQDLGRRHVGYGVTNRDYDTVAEALLWTLEKGLGPAFTADVRAAWIKTYLALATTMQHAPTKKVRRHLSPQLRRAKKRSAFRHISPPNTPRPPVQL